MAIRNEPDPSRSGRLMAPVTFQESNLKIRYQAAGEGAQTLARFFQPRPEALDATRWRHSQSCANGPNQLRSKTVQATFVAGAQIKESANIRPIEIAFEVGLNRLRPKHTIGQREIGQIADRVTAEWAEKTRNPKMKQFAQQRRDPTLITAVVMKLHRPMTDGAC